jgi:hypothetical protein
MRYYYKVLKKPSGKDLLVTLRAILDTTISREIANLTNYLGFKLSEIAELK